MSAIDDLLNTMARLRDRETGCPWDIEQTHKSLADCLVDECSELLETIDTLDMEHMREELGDVLLQVVFHAQMAQEAGHFDFDAVAAEINEKLVRRHPHVFGDMDLSTSDEVLTKWEEIKAQEKGKEKRAEKVFKDLPPSLPALMFARDIYKQLVKKSLPRGESVRSEAISELADGLSEEEAGQRLFELAAACREAGIDPESAVRRYARRVQSETEALAKASGV